MTTPIHLDGTLREEWDDDARIVTFYDAQGNQVGQRGYTSAEGPETVAVLDTSADGINRRRYLCQLAEGIPAIIAAREATQADLAVAGELQQQALAIASNVEAHIAQMAEWTPTANLAGVTALRDALVAVANRQRIIVTALAGSFAYRQAVDANAVLTDNAILFLARLASETLLDG